MKNLKSFIDSGILESYVLGNSTPEEAALVRQLAASYSEVAEEIDLISEALEAYALSNAIVPDAVVKPFLLATIDYTSRIQNGEEPSFPPILHEGSAVSDYAHWLDRYDMFLPDTFTDLHAKIIGYTPTEVTAIVWIKEMAPQEVHHHEYEKFLVVEGTCDITVEDETFSFIPGDYFSIPLHKSHHVVVTSSFPCKVILQRIAA